MSPELRTLIVEYTSPLQSIVSDELYQSGRRRVASSGRGSAADSEKKGRHTKLRRLPCAGRMMDGLVSRELVRAPGADAGEMIDGVVVQRERRETRRVFASSTGVEEMVGEMLCTLRMQRNFEDFSTNGFCRSGRWAMWARGACERAGNCRHWRGRAVSRGGDAVDKQSVIPPCAVFSYLALK